MKDKWKRYALAIRVAGVVVIVALVGVVAYYLKIYYSDRIGATPQKAVETYFVALGSGDYDEVYSMTTPDSMYDIYGRPITRSEFLGQLKRLGGDDPMPITRVEVEKLFEKEGVRYYTVALYSSVGGTPGKSRIIAQVHKLDGEWRLTYPFPIVLAVE